MYKKINESEKYNEWVGYSFEDKSLISNVSINDRFFEMDTQKHYFWNGKEWAVNHNVTTADLAAQKAFDPLGLIKELYIEGDLGEVDNLTLEYSEDSNTFKLYLKKGTQNRATTIPTHTTPGKTTNTSEYTPGVIYAHLCEIANNVNADIFIILNQNNTGKTITNYKLNFEACTDLSCSPTIAKLMENKSDLPSPYCFIFKEFFVDPRLSDITHFQIMQTIGGGYWARWSVQSENQPQKWVGITGNPSVAIKLDDELHVIEHGGFRHVYRFNTPILQMLSKENGWQVFTKVDQPHIVNDFYLKTYFGNEDHSQIEDYPSYVYNQDYYDDLLETKTGAMLRTDTCVLNQFCFGTSGTTELAYNILGQGTNIAPKDVSSVTQYRYFYWNDVEKTQGEYDYSKIAEFLQSCYAKKTRTGLRLFPNVCAADSPDRTTCTINGKTYTSKAPQYIVEKSVAYGQCKFHDGFLLTEWNDSEIRQAYIDLINNFSAWLYSETFEVDGNTIHYNDLVCYIDMGIYGPWGEGCVYEWNPTCSWNDLLEISNAYVVAFPDIQLNQGQWFRTYNADASNGEPILIMNRVALETRELSNSVGHVGMYLDNLGANNPIYRADYYIDEKKTSLVSKIQQWAERGDFFTGEFAMFAASDFWGTDQGLHALKAFKLFKAPHFRFHNMTCHYNNVGNLKLTTLAPNVWIELNRALACVGGRYVLRFVNGSKAGVRFTITNIGLRAAFFDFFNVKVRIRNLDADDEYIDVDTNIDLTTISPKAEPLLYAASNGFTYWIPFPEFSYTNFSVSIIGIDKLWNSQTMYFSNYDRNEDGSYLLATYNNNKEFLRIPKVVSVNEIITKTSEEISKKWTQYLSKYINELSDVVAESKYVYSDQMWTMEAKSVWVNTDGKFIPIDGAAIALFSRPCNSFDKFEAGIWNNSPVNSGYPSLLFYDDAGNLLGTGFYSRSDDKAQGEVIYAPLGTSKACYQCYNAELNNKPIGELCKIENRVVYYAHQFAAL